MTQKYGWLTIKCSFFENYIKVTMNALNIQSKQHETQLNMEFVWFKMIFEGGTYGTLASPTVAAILQKANLGT